MLTYNGQVHRLEMNIVGMEAVCSRNEKSNYFKVSRLWKEFNSKLSNIKNRVNRSSWQKFGIYYNSTGTNFNYMACIPVLKFEQTPPGFIEKKIPSLTYLEFIHTGSIEDIYSSVKVIYRKHLKEMNIQPLDQERIGVNHFEEYGKGFHWKRHDSELKILIPVGFRSSNPNLSKPELVRSQR
ncbi:GyrI-like domain-containing protein [Photobacterium lutimaris]|uniref:AraC effector-binding domain-containing protein n=1 Tax=Photobacterium lutimaris TaxID=388278 RepID=A0A2T3J2G0_9GAMM|nr:effector binding domain-containing protein [Photobacterium lutimaris]PSU35478.1 hypothetical protein C9I99_00175 [Photobacterium lutimaris]TDR78524.1 putative transcriptional regulator YdeE [Photobacterium lutimaris]